MPASCCVVSCATCAGNGHLFCEGPDKASECTPPTLHAHAVVFFGRRQMRESVKWMGAFWLTIAGSIASFAQISPLAAALFAPTQVRHLCDRGDCATISSVRVQSEHGQHRLP